VVGIDRDIPCRSESPAGRLSALALAGFAGNLAFGWDFGNSGGGDNGSEENTAMRLSLPGGQWLVGLVGVAVIGAGLSQVAVGLGAVGAYNLIEARYRRVKPARGSRLAVPSGSSPRCTPAGGQVLSSRRSSPPHRR
jgi:hypothetical protein